MRVFILVTLTILSFNLIANSYYDEEKSKQDYLNWHASLIQFINDHEDDNIVMIGLNESASSGKILSRNAKIEDRHDFVYSLNQLINNHKLTAQNLHLASSFCKSTYIQDICDIESLTSQLQQKDSDNLFSYFLEFVSAISEKDSEKIEYYLSTMSQTSYAKYPLLPDKKFYSVLKIYINQNPSSKESILNELHYMHLSPEDEEYILKNTSTFRYFLTAINFQLIMPIPPIKSLVDVCQSKLDYFQDCKKIAHILSNENSSTLSKLVGYSLNTKLSELYGTDSSKTKEKEELFRKKYKQTADEYNKCRRQQSYRQQLDYLPQYLNDLREFGELNALLLFTEVNCKATLNAKPADS